MWAVRQMSLIGPHFTCRDAVIRPVLGELRKWLTRGNLGRFPINWTCRAETALAGWGGRIRTSEWRNQKSLGHFDFITHFLPTKAKSAHDRSIRYRHFPDFRKRLSSRPPCCVTPGLNLQPSGYERVTLTGIINDYWHFRARSPTFVPVWLRRIIGYLLVGRWGAAPGLVSRGTDKAAASDIPGQPLRFASRIAFLQAAMGTSRRACSTVARRSNWKAMTGAATSGR